MKHLDTINGCVMFTDIKDFTLKSSLLTQYQIEKLLNKQDDIVLPIITQYFGKVIKTIGDSYMVVFERPTNTIKASIAIQVALQKYNKNIKLNLYKIELRITADYGSLDHQLNINGEDYFGETVNIAARLQNTTPENKIFISQNLRDKLPKILQDQSVFLGKTNFKGVLYDLGVYEVIYQIGDLKKLKNGLLEYKDIGDFYLTEDSKKRIIEIDESIFRFSSVAAIMGIQPFPFVDTYSVLPLHMFLLKTIANKYGFTIDTQQSKEIISTLFSSIGSSYLIGQTISTISKISMVGFGGYVMIPLNFALTYALGKTMSYYFYNKTQGIQASQQDFKKLFQYSTSYGKNIVKQDKSKIINTGQKYKKNIQEKFKAFYKQSGSNLQKIKDNFQIKK